jgi:hypothetical protein
LSGLQDGRVRESGKRKERDDDEKERSEVKI